MAIASCSTTTRTSSGIAKDRITLKVGGKQIELTEAGCNINNGNLEVT
jgi:hypothetical protein